MRLSVRNLLRSGRGAKSALDTVLTQLKERIPLILSLTDLGSGDAAIDSLQRLCQFLQREIANNKCGGETKLSARYRLANACRGAGRLDHYNNSTSCPDSRAAEPL